MFEPDILTAGDNLPFNDNEVDILLPFIVLNTSRISAHC